MNTYTHNGVETDMNSVAAVILAAGKGTVLHVEASGPDAAKAVGYLERLVSSGFGEP